jgi:hypothetical protein
MRRPRRQLCGGIAAGPISDPVSVRTTKHFYNHGLRVALSLGG